MMVRELKWMLMEWNEKVDLNCLLHKGCASKEEVQSSLVGCYALARDMCWSEVFLYSTRLTNSYRVLWPRW